MSEAGNVEECTERRVIDFETETERTGTVDGTERMEEGESSHNEVSIVFFFHFHVHCTSVMC